MAELQEERAFRRRTGTYYPTVLLQLVGKVARLEAKQRILLNKLSK